MTMILTANCKINIGLYITEKRDDGYHNLSSLFYPVKSLYDIIEIKPSNTLTFSQSGIAIDGDIDDNLCVKAFNAFNRKHNISGAEIHLHKQIPFGAGLGGGSSDAATVIIGLNQIYGTNLDSKELADIALEVGSDVPFFIYNSPKIVSGRGEIFSSTDTNLTGWHITIVKPDYGVSTKGAYSKITPHHPTASLLEQLKCDIGSWQGCITNDFEAVIFNDRMKEIKELLYAKGAVFASMSGSGSAIYALSKEELVDIDTLFSNEYIHKGVL